MYVLSHSVMASSFVTPWTIACQVPLSMGFSRQEYWSGLPFPPPRDCPDPGIELVSLASPALAGGFFYHLDTWEALLRYAFLFNSIHFQSGLHFLEVPITEPLFLSVTKEGVALSSTELEQVGETTVGLNKSTEVQQEL